MDLADLQNKFARYLLTGEGAGLSAMVGAGDFEPGERLAIYRNNFLIGLTEALLANFPVTTRLVGEDFMRQTARNFILTHPPQAPRLTEYGAEFPSYLSSLASLSGHPYVPEMAEYERRRIAAWDAPKEAALNAQKLSAIDPERLIEFEFRLARHASVLRHKYPLHALWRAHQTEECDVSKIDMTPRARATLIWRAGDRVQAIELGEAEALFLRALADGAKLGGAIAQAFGEDSERAQQMLALVLSQEILVQPG